MLPTKFQFIWPSGLRRIFFKNRPIRNKNYLWWLCLVMNHNKMCTLQVGIHILIFFLANLAKGNMSFCHHLLSVVCHPFTFHILIISSENPQLNELKLGRKHVVAMFVNRSGRIEQSSFRC
jgi:hypothetical protein